MFLRHFGLLFLFALTGTGCYCSHLATEPDSGVISSSDGGGDAGPLRPLLRIERIPVRAESCAMYGTPGPELGRLHVTSLTSERLFIRPLLYPLYIPEAFGLPLVSGGRLWDWLPDMRVLTSTTSVSIQTDSIQTIDFNDANIPLEGLGDLDLDLDPDFVSFDEVGYSEVGVQMQVAPQTDFVVMTESGRSLLPEEIEVVGGLPVLLGQWVYVFRSLFTVADSCTPEMSRIMIGGEQVVAHYSLTSLPNPGGYEATILDLGLELRHVSASGQLLRIYEGTVSPEREMARGLVSDANAVVWDDASFPDIVLASVDHRDLFVTLETDGIPAGTEIQVGISGIHWSDGSLHRVLGDRQVSDQCALGVPFYGCLRNFASP